MDAAVQLEGVSRRFRGADREIVALDDISVSVAAGSFVAVMGATGSGKSTFLNCAAALERPSAGVVRLLGHDVGRMRERVLTRLRRDSVGFVFQSYNLLSELTVAQNVLLPHRLGAPATRTVADVLAAVGLTGTEQRPTGELSGGQRQRVAIARALSTGPEVIFADEPTGSLDPVAGAQILQLLRVAAESGTTVIMVTHDPAAAATTARLILLRAGQIVDDRPTPARETIARRLEEVAGGAAAGVSR
jgi:putative ABC transport system ATP-binding protein